MHAPDGLGPLTKRALLLTTRSEFYPEIMWMLVYRCHIESYHVVVPAECERIDQIDNFALIVATPTSLDKLASSQYFRLIRTATIVLLVGRRNLRSAAAYAAWADGFLFENQVPDGVCRSIRLARHGHAICPHAAGRDLTFDSIRKDKMAAMPSRELEVFDRLAEGETNRYIARHLGMTEREVRNRVHAILSKLEFDNRTEAGVFAHRFRATLREHRDTR